MDDDDKKNLQKKYYLEYKTWVKQEYNEKKSKELKLINIFVSLQKWLNRVTKKKKVHIKSVI